MYSVLVVDDEDPVLESYTYLIRSALDGFVVCGSARSGHEALEIAERQRPDVVLMDIAMPGIDGIDTIERMRRDLPETLYILSTAYERFDIAQRAIPLGVFSYLVKPVSRKRFLETMFKVKDALDTRGSSLPAVVGTDVAQAQTDLIRGILWQSLGGRDVERYARALGLSGEGGCIAVIDTPDAGHYAAIAERISLRHRCAWAAHDGRMVLYVEDRASAETLRTFLAGVASDVCGARIPVGVGSRKPATSMYQSAQEALDHVPGHTAAVGYAQDIRRQSTAFCHAVVRNAHDEDVGSLSAAFLDNVLGQSDLRTALFRLASVVDRVVAEAAERTGNDDCPGLQIDAARELALLMDPPDLRAIQSWFTSSVLRVRECTRQRRSGSWPGPLSRAYQYMEANFASGMQLSDVAEHAGVSVGYLSRLFSDYAHTSFNDALNALRLDAAEELMKTSDRSIKEVAYEVGYHSPGYFSRMFRKRHGRPPTRFAEGDA